MDIFKNISWLASYPKSGSTWVRMFINAFMTKMPLNINSTHQISRLDKDHGLMQLLCPIDIKTLNHSEQFMYRPAMLLNMLKLSPGSLVLKTHMAKIALDKIPAHPVQMTDVAVYIIRDPRDICISLSHHLGKSIDDTIEFMSTIHSCIEDDDKTFVEILLTWSRHIESWTNENKNIPTLVVKYEDMLSDPINTFMQILEHLRLLNVTDIEQRFDFALKESSFKNLQELEDLKIKGFVEKGKGERFFRVGRAGQWKEVLTDRQAEKICEDHKNIMEEFGYAQKIIST
jgi:hypothetical protein